MIHQVGSKTEWLFLSASFSEKFGLVFYNTGKRFFLLKDGTRDIQNSLPFERSACFYVIITENFESFQYFNFETDFLENENHLQKTGVSFFN